MQCRQGDARSKQILSKQIFTSAGAFGVAARSDVVVSFIGLGKITFRRRPVDHRRRVVAKPLIDLQEIRELEAGLVIEVHVRRVWGPEVSTIGHPSDGDERKSTLLTVPNACGAEVSSGQTILYRAFEFLSSRLLLTSFLR